MGRCDRERIAAIEAGNQTAISKRPKMRIRRCLLCEAVISDMNARPHIRECWQFPIGDNDPVPEAPPEEVRIAYLERNKKK